MSIEDFDRYLKFEKRYSSHTIKSYITDVKQFYDFMSLKCEDVNLERIQNSDVRRWVVSLMQNKFSNVSVNRKISAISSFFSFLITKNAVKDNPAKGVIKPKKANKVVKYLPVDSMNFLLSEVEFGEDFCGQRDRLILEFFYGTGIRLSELINLRDKDILLSEGSIKVLGKGNKERLIPLHKGLINQIKSYLRCRESEFKTTELGYFFVTLKTKSLYPMFLYRMVNKYLRIISARAKISPHILRHTFATHLLDGGADLNDLKELLGHSNLTATQIYTHVSTSKLKKIFKVQHPRG